MSSVIKKTRYTGPIQAVVLDWAGTAVDYGCMGPAAVFVEAFRQFDVNVSVAEARQFMGLEKKEHIRAMLKLDDVLAQWHKINHTYPGEKEVEAIYAKTEPMMIQAILKHSQLINGALDFVNEMKKRRIKIGSSTGYTRPMMDVLAPMAAKNGYRPDAVVCSSDVPNGRPYPWMCYLNAMQLKVYPMQSMVKIGDTINDIKEGLNAGMWTIGLTRSGNELGLTKDEADQLKDSECKTQLNAISDRFYKAGAHYVADGIWECLSLIDDIAHRIKLGECP